MEHRPLGGAIRAACTMTTGIILHVPGAGNRIARKEGRMAIRYLALILTTAVMLAATQLAASRPPAASADRAGSAAAIGCTQAELAAALAAGGSISFNCGPGPHSILFNTPLLVTTTASIDGGDQITASGQNITSLFLIQPGAALTLTHLTVTKGFANNDGGAVRIS